MEVPCSSRNAAEMQRGCSGLLALFFLASVSVAQVIDIRDCCRFTRNISVRNDPARHSVLSDGRRAILFCALDSANVPNFDLGFLEQGRAGAGNFTVSIFLRAPTRMSIVEELWSANTAEPVGINSTLVFEVGKGLMLEDEHQRQVWNATAAASAGFFLDCRVGNLILFDTSNSTVWQSFDHPTDTLVQTQILKPGMQLTSRGGSYSLVMQLAGLALYDNKQSLPYWILAAAGVANDSRGVTSRNCGMNATIFDPGFMSFESKTCSIPTINFSSFPGFNRTRFMKLDETGSLRVFDWNQGSTLVDHDFLGATSACALPASCGRLGLCQGNGQCSCLADPRFSPRDPSDDSQGCNVSGGDLSCGGGRTDDMLSLASGVTSPFNRYADTNLKPSSAEECRGICLGNCSCRAAFYESSSGSCFTYGDSFQSFQADRAGDVVGFVKLARTTQPRRSSFNKAAAVAIPCAVLAVLGTAVLVVWRAQKNKRQQKQQQGSVEMDDPDEEAFLDSLPGLPPRYSISALEEATDGFSRKLGHGGFGEVYFGRLSDGTEVAVKKLASAHQGNKEFRAEVATIGNIHHVNLVRLRGFCAEGSNRLLVYEYMSNGSLDKWLFRRKDDPDVGPLDWNTKFDIALGTAKGLAYLHHSCKEKILHLDVKPQNILLDERFRAKVADFGLAKLVGGDETHVFTTMRGTPGYLAPEWLSSAISEKSDVFSYGIVLLELLSGRHNFRRSEEDVMLSFWAFSKLEEGRPLDVVEAVETLDEKQKAQAESLVLAALWCIQIDPGVRPSMNKVVLMLEGLLATEMPPPWQREPSKNLQSFVMSSVSSWSESTLTPGSSSLRPR